MKSSVHGLIRSVVAALLLLAGTAALAGPGTHGPGGEHLDAGKGTTASATARPRIEAKSELFELVGYLHGDELSVMINRFETNEPVLDAKVEISAGALKAAAKFHTDHGDYAIDDAAFLKALAKPGEHALIFTIIAGSDSDLLEGTLAVTQAQAHDHAGDHGHTLEYVLIAGAALVVLIGVAIVRRRRAAAVLAIATLCVITAHAGPGAHGPGGEHIDAAGGTGRSGLARLPDGSVNVPMASQRVMGIRTRIAPETETAATVELPGKVVVDPNAGGRVQAVLGGRVEGAANGLPVPGQKVQRGQVLAYLRHHAEPFAQANQQAELASLRASRTLAEQRVKRLESLEGTVPRKDIEAARAELTSLTQREQSIGRSLGAREALTAPVSGVIARADATLGQVVNAGEVLFEVVDPGRILIEATTVEVALGQRIDAATLSGIPGVTLRFVGAARSLREGVLPLTFRAEAAKAGAALPLAIGQPVTVVATLNERIKGIVLPAQAVVRSPANEPVVWVKVGAERYLPQRVAVQTLDAENVVVTQGLGADNRVVVQGAPLLAQIR